MQAITAELTASQRLKAESMHMSVEVRIAADKIDELEAENEKLRKLARDLRSNVCSIYGGEPCSVLCQGYDPGTHFCYYEKRMCDLGIEVK